MKHLGWLVVLMLFQAAAPAQEPPADLFEARIRPVLVDRCYSCHSARAEKLKGRLRLDTPEGMKKVLVPGDPDRSPLITAIRYRDENLKMPPKQPLTSTQIEDFESWVRRGAVDPRAVARNPSDAAARGHWAFQPLQDPPVPGVPGLHPIDAFVRARLEKEGLRPSPPADRRTLLRRVTYDLVGLPPTAEEIASFLADPSPNAFERVVDRLLASPHYGERWGRHWLDAARYADTKGYTQIPEERRFAHAHTYRDWVVRAFNDDLPYDQFLIRQIAADRLVEEDRGSLAALGFLTVGRRFKNVIHDIIDDRIDVLCRTTMGLTVSCARCHDHKFDPITTQDYYGLYGVFAGTTERRVALVDKPGSDAFDQELRRREEAFRKALQAVRERLEDRHRRRIRDYLVQVVESDKLPPEEAFLVLQPDELNPVVVRRWQSALAKAGRTHPVFGLWNAFAGLRASEFAAGASELLGEVTLSPFLAPAFGGEPPASMRDVAERYGDLLATVKRSSGSPAEAAMFGPESPVNVPARSLAEIEFFLDTDSHAELTRLQSVIDRWICDSDDAPPYAGILEDLPLQIPARVFLRGNPIHKGEEVDHRFPTFLTGGTSKPFRDGSGRLELARAIVDPANPLTARVLVNRLWLHHFGQGLVRTPSDFGRRSDPPSHPELLDWLARRFIEGDASTPLGMNWSIKKMHRLILSSETYRQDSRDNPVAARRDPGNTLLWRVDRRRLDLEAMRDSFLAVSGELDPSIGGPPEDLTSQPFTHRRTLYGFIDRLNLPNLFPDFDFPSPDSHNPQRAQTTVAPQALFLLNSPFLLGRARAVAMLPEIAAPPAGERRIQAVYRRLYGRAATAQEVEWGLSFVGGSGPGDPAPTPSAWQYGLGEYDDAARRVKRFAPLGHYMGNVWHDGPTRLLISLSAQVLSLKSGWASLAAEGGHPGRDAQHAVIRRWIAPRDGKIQVRGTLRLEGRGGDGVRARVASSRLGELLARTLDKGSADMDVPEIDVRAGDAIDFVVDGRADPNEDLFKWAPTIRMGTQEWSAAKEFGGPSVAPLDAWGRYAQVLLASNEFIFID